MSSRDSAANTAAAVPRVRVDSLHKRFGAVPVVNGVSISVNPGEVVGLIGPNGSGKSTLLNCIAGVLRPNGGSVLLDESDVTRAPTHKRARMGLFYSFQRTRLLPEMTVAEHIAMALGSRRVAASFVSRGWAHAADDPVIDEVLDRFLLSHVRHHPAGSLSFGQRQLLCLALAMAGESRTVLLDEPLAGLSGESIVRISEKVAEAAARGAAVLIVEHRLKSLLTMCDRFIVLHEGAVIADGQPNEVMDDPDVSEAYFGKGRQFGRV